ncbi:MAG: cobalt ECF transporter T component CbiQ [Planctomycetaceae bacterium]|jgi:cobalt/nickel transport system permease protein|nr:cobalt ECF transporter T component CbiQ [Planctomycetaceae bacterium]
MIYIDKYAYFSGLKEVSPPLKILFGGTALIACLCSKSFLSFAIVFLTMFYVTVFKAKIPLDYYIKLLLLPFCFLLFSVIGVIVNFTRSPLPDSCVLHWCFGNNNLFISEKGMVLASRLVCKSLSAVSCLYFIILTTPFRDIIYFLHVIRYPKTLLTLTVLIYQFIFLLMEIATVKMKSQLCRGGYRTIKGFARSFAMLWGSVFIQSYLKSEWVYKSMLARGYCGHFQLLPKEFRINKKEIALLLLFFLFVMIPNLF